MRRPIRSIAALLALPIAFTACGSASDDSTPPGSRTNANGCVTDYVEGRDYFADKSTVEESELWDVTYHDSYKTITLTDTENARGDKLVYVLYQCGTPKPPATGDLANALFVQVPATNVSVTSFNALAMVDRLGKNDTITGLSGQLLANGEKDQWYAGVIDDAGKPMSIGEYTDLNREAILGLQNQIILMSGFGKGFDDITNARAAELPGVSVSNRMERHALASAEWVKMVAAFYNEEAAANAEFNSIKTRFNNVMTTISGKVDKRTVGYLCIAAERGCEFIYAHGNETLVGRLFAQFGATNVFAPNNDELNGRAYDLEESIGTGTDADFLIVYDPMSATLNTLKSDERMMRFQPFAEKNFIAGVDKNFEECRAKTYLDVDVLIRDFALGLAPDLFPETQGTCFVRSP
ncbi:ABC transporter substrate-binding protein [Actinopolymorpha alba]|uniref:ABC transporter substrate-binding protein n=1 Tax=Actinopolymorpha alba TaxID=533267 RepID=UPI00036C0056|nr:ABC transporter substrate-binding protein [Actinopolymorpha alba]